MSVDHSKREAIIHTGKSIAALTALAAINPSLTHGQGQIHSGGLFRLAVGSGSSNDNIDVINSHFMELVHFACFDNLCEIERNDEVVEKLAQTIETNDGKTWYVSLKKGIEFHNGKELTAKDVAARILYLRDNKSRASGMLSIVSDIKTMGKYFIEIELARPNYDFLHILSDYHIGITYKDSKGAIFGTGAYILKEFEPGVRAYLTKNRRYWHDGRGHFDEVEILSVHDDQTRLNLLNSGDVHYIDDLKPLNVANIGNNKPLVAKSSMHVAFPMRVDKAPFNNYDLRMALKLSIDRKQLINDVYRGYAYIGNDHPIPAYQKYYNNELPQRDIDLDKARYHLRKSGFSGKIQLHASESAGMYPIARSKHVVEAAKRIGIDAEFKREPSDGYWSDIWNKKPWAASYWSGRPTPDWMFSAAYTNDTEWNETAWRTSESAERFNRLVVLARKEPNEKIRKEMYFECQRLIHDDGGSIIPCFMSHIGAVSPSIIPSSSGSHLASDGAKCIERWSFAS